MADEITHTLSDSLPEELREVLTISPAVLYTCKPEGDFPATFVSPSITQQLGHFPEDFLNDSRFWVENIHPQDVRGVFEGLNILFEEGRHVHEYRFRHRDGSYRWLRDECRLVRRAGGAPKTVIGYWIDITERKQAEESVRESQAAHADAMALAHLGHWDWSVDTNKVRWSAESYRIFGRSAEQIGDTYEGFLATVHPDDRARVMANVEASITTGDPYRCEYRIVLPDGETVRTIDAQGRATLDPDTGAPLRLMGTVLDITERRTMQEALRDREELLRQVTENIREVFWVSDPTTEHIFYISPAYEQIWGRSCQSLYENPRSFLDSVHPDDRGAFQAAVDEKQGTGFDETYRIIQLDGSIRWIRDRAFPVRDEQGDVFRVVGIAEDITELRNLQAQLAHAQKMDAIGTLAGGVAHDFNNLLAAIMTTAEAVLGYTDSEDPRHTMLKQILETGARGAGVVRSLLDFSRKAEMLTEPVHPDRLIAALISLIEATFDPRIRIVTDMRPMLKPVRVDEGRMHQALMNLCVNARDAILEAGGDGQITITARNVDVTGDLAVEHRNATPGSYVLVSVRDDGCGIPESIASRILDPFFTTKGPGKGTGLGLSTVYGIVDSHGGFMTFDSEEGRGTTFNLYLPVADPAGSESGDEKGPADALVSSRTTAGEQSMATILFAEDEPLLRQTVSGHLAEHGYRVVTAVDGNDALRQIARLKEVPNLVILDMMMPGMSGKDVLKRLRQNHPDLPVIVMSGLSGGVLQSELAKLGCASFLEKPYSLDVLVAEVKRLLEPESGRSSVM